MADSLLDSYNPLYDVHLQQYFTLPHMQKHLRRMGLLAPSRGDDDYARHYVMVDMMLKNREVQLMKMYELRKKLDAAQKVETCRRIRSGQSPVSSHRTKPSRSLSRGKYHARLGGPGHSKKRSRSSSSVDNNEIVEKIEEEHSEPVQFNPKDPYSRLSATVKRFQYLHRLDDSTLNVYKENLKKQLQRLERFRDVSFGVHSVARQPPTLHQSWFFRRRSCNNVRGRQSARSTKPNQSKESRTNRTSCPPSTNRRRKDSNGKLPSIANPRAPKLSAPQMYTTTSTSQQDRSLPTRGRSATKKPPPPRPKNVQGSSILPHIKGVQKPVEPKPTAPADIPKEETTTAPEQAKDEQIHAVEDRSRVAELMEHSRQMAASPEEEKTSGDDNKSHDYHSDEDRTKTPAVGELLHGDMETNNLPESEDDLHDRGVSASDGTQGTRTPSPSVRDVRSVISGDMSDHDEKHDFMPDADHAHEKIGSEIVEHSEDFEAEARAVEHDDLQSEFTQQHTQEFEDRDVVERSTPDGSREKGDMGQDQEEQEKVLVPADTSEPHVEEQHTTQEPEHESPTPRREEGIPSLHFSPPSVNRDDGESSPEEESREPPAVEERQSEIQQEPAQDAHEISAENLPAYTGKDDHDDHHEEESAHVQATYRPDSYSPTETDEHQVLHHHMVKETATFYDRTVSSSDSSPLESDGDYGDEHHEEHPEHDRAESPLKRVPSEHEEALKGETVDENDQKWSSHEKDHHQGEDSKTQENIGTLKSEDHIYSDSYEETPKAHEYDMQSTDSMMGHDEEGMKITDNQSPPVDEVQRYPTDHGISPTPSHESNQAHEAHEAHETHESTLGTDYSDSSARDHESSEHFGYEHGEESLEQKFEHSVDRAPDSGRFENEKVSHREVDDDEKSTDSMVIHEDTSHQSNDQSLSGGVSERSLVKQDSHPSSANSVEDLHAKEGIQSPHEAGHSMEQHEILSSGHDENHGEDHQVSGDDRDDGALQHSESHHEFTWSSTRTEQHTEQHSTPPHEQIFMTKLAQDDEHEPEDSKDSVHGYPRSESSPKIFPPPEMFEKKYIIESHGIGEDRSDWRNGQSGGVEVDNNAATQGNFGTVMPSPTSVENVDNNLHSIAERNTAILDHTEGNDNTRVTYKTFGAVGGSDEENNNDGEDVDADSSDDEKTRLLSSGRRISDDNNLVQHL
ncbi:hypothetical protein Q1695_000373 [Nippostrongylus brasiliensis]|nr:hypothetical protein Q1695_000373 [Nippostrongylus brasiliensis]